MQSLYIHIPFCEKKCFYCSFVVAVGKQHRVKEYLSALSKEDPFCKEEEIESVYIGGGTPSYLNEDELDLFFSLLYKKFKIKHGAEITFECNPEGLSLEKARLLKKAGVNRASLGVQTFNDSYLKYLGRCHDAAKAVESFKLLNKSSFDSVNIDLMYSFPGQSNEEIEGDVKMIQSLGPQHVSLYTLSVEKNSRFHARNLMEEGPQRQATQYRLVTSLLDGAGFIQYEISNFSRPGFQSKHNMNYWLGGNYAGLGVGAHSHYNGRRQWNVTDFMEYMRRMSAGESPVLGREELPKESQLIEKFLIGLRMNDGINLSELQEQVQGRLTKEKMSILTRYVKDDFLTREGDVFRATEKGRTILDELAVNLI